MAKTYSAIQTQTINSAVSSVTFINIPQNYTDLKILVSARSTNNSHRMYLQIAVNGSSTLTGLRLMGYDNTNTLSGSGQTNQIGFAPGTATGTGVFSNTDISIPSYSSSTTHAILTESVHDENSSVYNSIGLYANYFGTSAAVTSLTFTLDLGNFDVGTTFTLYGVGSGAKATGGTVTGSGNYMYHTFTSTGSFIPTEQIKNAEVLLVAGGGGGGYNGGGGGGAGGLRTLTNLPFVAGTSYAVTVGSGGAGATNSQGNSGFGFSGTNSSLSLAGVSADGGGGAGCLYSLGLTGGSGGGNGKWQNGNPGSGNVGGYSPVEGFIGGTGPGSGATGGGGGGGAGGAGTNGSSNGGAGGVSSALYAPWLYATQTGVNIGGTYYIAGGGGGGSDNTGGSASGGGGAGGSTNSNGTVGTANTGGGGGGGGTGSSAGNGAAGGSGLVIIRYPIN